MGGKIDIAKGRVEEAAGVLSGNARLRAKGQTNQAAGRIKEAGEKSVRQIKASARKLEDNAKNSTQKAVARIKSK
jgi:uncharacterized protein YjbJ (UPF0337 family)